MSHGTRHTVLLIEQDPSLRRLIALGLQYRSIRVIEANSLAHLPAIDIEEQLPDLLLLDIDGGVSSDWSLLTTLQAHPYLSTLPIVVLAWENVLPGPGYTHNPATHTTHTAQTRMTCLTKPFDARALHTTIEQLLLESVPQTADAAQEVLLIAQSASPAPSIWPIITAAALLLTFIGLMIHITITVIGLLIFLIALLGWTLGTKPESAAVSSTRLGV